MGVALEWAININLRPEWAININLRPEWAININLWKVLMSDTSQIALVARLSGLSGAQRTASPDYFCRMPHFVR